MMIGWSRRRDPAILVFLISLHGWKINSVVAANARHSFQPAIGRRSKSPHQPSDCESLSFLFQDRQSIQRQSGIATSPPNIQTHVGRVSGYFVGLIDETTNDIHLPKLLNACTHFADAMVKVDQRQSAKDMRQNIRKVQTYGDNTTMRQVLQYEKMHSNLHTYDDTRLVRLGEHSCAIGLLWIRRSLEFQYNLFAELLRENESAVQTAYQQTLSRYHGWGLQKVYSIALKATSGGVLATTAQLGGFDPKHLTKDQYDTTRRDLQVLMDLWKPLLLRWNQIYDELNLQDMRKV